MIISAPILSALQRCPRLLVLRQTQPMPRWHPKILFDMCLRAGIRALCTGDTNPAGLAIEMFLKQAKAPGLDTAVSPWTISQDYIACLQTIFEYVSRETQLVLKPGPSIVMGEDLTWECSSFADEGGQLHRWCTVASLDEDSLAAELHSWYVSGDMLAAKVPMMLHIVEIGSQRKGHQHTAWCKAYKHPAVAGRFAFQKQDGRPLEGGWKPIWFQDSNSNNAKDWVDMMVRDNVQLVHHRVLKQASAALCERNVAHVKAEAARLQALPEDFRTLPIFRPACDRPYVCPWQWKCYGAEGA